jgi:vacuolar-type H+-ATPase subunit I/STV1
MTDISPGNRNAWRTSADTRDEETRSDALARERARERDAGWIHFATAMLVTIGVFQIVTGLSALVRKKTFLVPTSRLILDVGYPTWGWFYIVLGVLAFAAAAGLQQRRPWARLAGVVLAVVSAVGNIGFLPVRPFTSAAVILLNVLVIYGITVHGGRAGTRFYVDRA